MQDGNTMRNNYGCDLDALGTGARIGMMRTAKGDLHYFINGQDQGAACSGLPPGKGDYSVLRLPPFAQLAQDLRLLIPFFPAQRCMQWWISMASVSRCLSPMPPVPWTTVWRPATLPPRSLSLCIPQVPVMWPKNPV